LITNNVTPLCFWHDDIFDRYDTPVEGRKINWMKAGILEADRVLTVSPYYAQELISGEARGCELDNIMRLTGITGIVNGMDVSEWDPRKDKYIAVKYDVETVSLFSSVAVLGGFSTVWFWRGKRDFHQAIQAKALNKEALQASVGLPVDRDVPVIASVRRLEEQKGPDVMAAATPRILAEKNVQIVLLVRSWITIQPMSSTRCISWLTDCCGRGIEPNECAQGTGKKKFERLFKGVEEKHPDNVRAVVKFNAPLAHHILAGADLLAVPSRAASSSCRGCDTAR
jgi:granule-bound starch synthase